MQRCHLGWEGFFILVRKKVAIFSLHYIYKEHLRLLFPKGGSTFQCCYLTVPRIISSARWCMKNRKCEKNYISVFRKPIISLLRVFCVWAMRHQHYPGYRCFSRRVALLFIFLDQGQTCILVSRIFRRVTRKYR